jgi:23S rRNA (cytidine1920-2'-O)/16S rRNA (cytidine1409-2'-O)-methyltransferase
MHHRIRTDGRVTVVERTNIRHADPEALGAPFDLVVADLSFISLALVAPQLASLGSNVSDWVLLVKPQFEVGKELVGKGGIVRDPDAHVLAIEQAADALAANGIGVIGLVVSSITGAEGNREFLVHGRITERLVDAGTVRAIVLEESQS